MLRQCSEALATIENGLATMAKKLQQRDERKLAEQFPSKPPSSSNIPIQDPDSQPHFPDPLFAHHPQTPIRFHPLRTIQGNRADTNFRVPLIFDFVAVLF